jgi:hypothetical protein
MCIEEAAKCIDNGQQQHGRFALSRLISITIQRARFGRWLGHLNQATINSPRTLEQPINELLKASNHCRLALTIRRILHEAS